ncbi:unnamed protein product [Anisakis simplex]|uniref:Galactose mutarotase N-terminal barrel domain-containing protein n=1 Tax=Anisakis simplex TaxID=6269 RepID=A0A3P6QM81_ANISI|nr:unnamed protein product [Anisakis simplex]
MHIDNSSDMFAFKVSRSNGSTPIWDTSIGSFLFSDQYIQIATFLPSDRVFGFGEHAHSSLKHDLSRYTTWGMLARDEMPEYSERPLKNLYGVHPFYLCVESDFSAHGVFFANSAPQEVTLGPGPHLVYRTIGGNLDIYIFEGPTPQMVIEQYLQLVGMPLLPPLWSLGFQTEYSDGCSELSSWSILIASVFLSYCLLRIQKHFKVSLDCTAVVEIGRNGYASANELDQVVRQTESRGILFNVININTDYMHDFNDFTLNNDWKQLTNITQKWHEQGYKLTIFINTGISVKNPWFKDAIDNNVSFIEWPTEDLVPTETNSLYAETNGTKVAFDGVWLSGDEPTSFGTNQQNPWYFNDSAHHAKIVPLKCPLSGTSTYPSSGSYAGHWLGATSARWDDLRGSIITTQEFNMFGIPYVGAYICGDDSTVDDVELSEEFQITFAAENNWYLRYPHRYKKKQPIMQVESVEVSAYLPNGRWYSLGTEDYGLEIAPGDRLFSASGNCIPRQRTASTALLSLMNPFDLLIALDETDHAEGSFRWEYGADQSKIPYQSASNFVFNANPENSVLLITSRIHDSRVPPFDVIEVLGIRYVPDLTSVKIDSHLAKVDQQKSYWNEPKKLIHIEGDGLIHLQTNTSITIEWNHKKFVEYFILIWLKMKTLN